ncbi:MAG: AMIN domain-containing protein [Cyanobacteria bacterium J06635_15]
MNSRKVAVGLGLSMQMILGSSGMGAIPLAIATVAAIARPAQATVLSNWAFDPATRQLQVMLPNGVTPRYFLLAEPTRIVLDIPNTEVGNVPTQQTYSGAITSIRIAQFDNRSTRIVIELAPNTVLDPQQAQLEQVMGETQTRWVLQPLLADTAPSAVPDGMPVAAQMADDPALADPTPAMQFSEEDPGVPLAEVNQNSLLTLAEGLNNSNADSNPDALPGVSTGEPTESGPTVSVPPLASTDAAPPTDAPDVTVPPLDDGNPSANDTSTASNPAAALDSVANQPEQDDSLAITPEEAENSVPIAVEPTGPAIAEVAEAAPTMPPFLAGTTLNEESAALNLPEPATPDLSATPNTDPEAVAVAPVETETVDEPNPSPPTATTTPPPAPTGATEPLPDLTEPTSEAPTPGLTDPTPETPAPEIDPSDNPEADVAPPAASPNTTSEPATTPLPETPPFLEEPEVTPAEPPAPPVATPTPTPQPNAEAAPTIPFGQPLPTDNGPTTNGPTTNGGDAQLRSLNPTSPVTPFAEALLTAGTTLPLAYTHSRPLVVTGTEPLQEVLVLNQDVRSTQTGNIVLPRGTLVIGRFETDGTNRTFVTQALSLQGQNIPISAQSEAIIGDPEVSENSLLRNSGIGAAALTILTGFTGVGLIGGAALGAATTYAVSPQTVIIEPNQVIQVTLVEDTNVGVDRRPSGI